MKTMVTTSQSALIKGWQSVPLSTVVEPVKDHWKPGDTRLPYIGLEHIAEQSLTLNGIGDSDSVQSNKFRFTNGDVLFGKLRPYFRKVVQVSFDGICSTDILVLRAREGYDQKFLFYFVANPLFIDRATKANTGTRMPRADWGYLQDTKWLVPSLPEQKAIAAVLSSLDDKIELLRRQNETLEKIAQALFKEWFVEFNFPDKDGRPYKACGGEMIDSELGPIPEEFRVGTLSDEFTIIMGQSPPGSSYNSEHMGMKFFQGITEFGFRFPGERLYTTEPRKIAERFDVLLSVRAPVGQINVAPDRLCIGRGLSAIRSEFKSYCLYKLMSLGERIAMFDSEGTVFGAITKDGLESLKVVIPDKTLISRFEAGLSPIDAKIFHNYREMTTLVIMRDLLLPKLMSGEIRADVHAGGGL